MDHRLGVYKKPRRGTRAGERSGRHESEMLKTRLVILCDPRDVAVRLLVPELLRQIVARSDCSCAALVMTHSEPTGFRSLRHWGRRLDRGLQAALGSGRLDRAVSIPPLAAGRLGRRYAIPVLLAPEGDPNHPKIRERLGRDLQADVALSLYCKTRFKEPLLSSFDMGINYHNGALPRFRGLRASNWSLYLEEPTSGYTFHRMDSGLDTGGVLAEGAVPVLAVDTPADLEARKAEAACLVLPQVIDAAVRRDTGRAQAGMAGNYNRQAFLSATQVEDPSALTHAEWLRRLRAFLRIKTNIAGNWFQVTGVVPTDGPHRLAFRTADGRWLRVGSVDFLPSWLARPTLTDGD